MRSLEDNPIDRDVHKSLARSVARSRRRARVRAAAVLALVLALVAPWGYGEEPCPHQGRSSEATVVNPASGDLINCSTGQVLGVPGIRTESGSSVICPQFTTTGMNYHYPTGKWNHRVVDSNPVENTRTNLTCSLFSIVWGLYSDADCDVLNTLVIQTEISVSSDAYCPNPVEPLNLVPAPKGNGPSEDGEPGTPLPQPTPGMN